MANKYHTYDTRNSQSLRPTSFKLDISKNCIYDHGVNIWNKQPNLALLLARTNL